MLDSLKEELLRRISEAGSTIQWITILTKRSQHNKDKTKRRISEKEFNLLYSGRVDCNPETLKLNEEEIPNLMARWIGRQAIFKQVGDLDKPRIKFDHSAWETLTRPPGGPP